MASQKFTVTLPKKQLEEVRALVQADGAPTMSAFVQKAVAMALDDLRGWETSLEQMLEATGGPLRADEQAWLDRLFGTSAA